MSKKFYPNFLDWPIDFRRRLSNCIDYFVPLFKSVPTLIDSRMLNNMKVRPFTSGKEPAWNLFINVAPQMIKTKPFSFMFALFLICLLENELLDPSLLMR